MVRVPKHVRDCAIYLYRTEEDATKHPANGGGSGFLVHVRLSETQVQYYVITNAHVLRQDNYVLRFSTWDGNHDTIATVEGEWEFHERGDDIAAYPVTLGPAFRRSSVNIKQFITKEHVKQNVIGPGDDVFMVGRLVTQEGIKENTPVLRFGNLAGMVTHIERPNSQPPQVSLLVECRSVSGFSGSPVFISVDQELSVATMTDTMEIGKFPHPVGGPWLLGIDWCHIPTIEKVYRREIQLPSAKVKLVETDHRVTTNTGIMGVIPAWRITQLLNQEIFVEQRRILEKEAVKIDEHHPILDSSQPEPADFTESDFEDALKKVSRKLPDEEKSET